MSPGNDASSYIQDVQDSESLNQEQTEIMEALKKALDGFDGIFSQLVENWIKPNITHIRCVDCPESASVGGTADLTIGLTNAVGVQAPFGEPRTVELTVGGNAEFTDNNQQTIQVDLEAQGTVHGYSVSPEKTVDVTNNTAETVSGTITDVDGDLNGRDFDITFS